MSESARDDGFAIEPRNKFFEANRAIVEHEMRPGRTVSFLSEVDLTQVERVRKDAPTSSKPSYTTLVVKAVALALRDFPYANRRVCRWGIWPFRGHRLQAFTHRDVAVAIERDIPGAEATAFLDIIREADLASLDQINGSLRALAKANISTNAQWREFSGLITRFPGWLSSRMIRMPLASPKLWVKYRGGAVLISSPGKYGVDAILGTWPHPIGISFGMARLRPVAIGERVEVRPTFFLTMNFDRRVMAGAQAAQFFKRIVDVLERAEAEMKPFYPEEAPVTRETFTTVEVPAIRSKPR